MVVERANLIVERMDLKGGFHEIEDLVYKAFTSEARGLDAANGPTGRRHRQLDHILQVDLSEGVVEAYLSETLTPSLTSLTASLTISGVMRLSVPNLSFLPSLSKMPHAQPLGMPLTGGRLS